MSAPGATPHGDAPAADDDAAGTPVAEGSRDAAFLALYDQLRALARLHLASERRHHTLQATALVHDAWLHLARAGASRDCSPAQLLAAASRAMRRVLIDHARARVRIKRGGHARPLSLDAVDLAASGSFAGILAVDEAIRRLEQTDPKAAEVVRLRFYVGLGMEEVARALGMSERSAFREWSYARAWLFRHLNGDPG
jgi:RNA polymerase sigma factor (TIGR02999 family)